MEPSPASTADHSSCTFRPSEGSNTTSFDRSDILPISAPNNCDAAVGGVPCFSFGGSSHPIVWHHSAGQCGCMVCTGLPRRTGADLFSPPSLPELQPYFRGQWTHCGFSRRAEFSFCKQRLTDDSGEAPAYRCRTKRFLGPINADAKPW